MSYTPAHTHTHTHTSNARVHVGMNCDGSRRSSGKVVLTRANATTAPACCASSLVACTSFIHSTVSESGLCLSGSTTWGD